MRLGELARALTILETRGQADPEMRGIAYDSREVRPGYLFVAMEGQHTDGHRFIDQALQRGAAAVLHSLPLASYREGIPYLRVENSRRALSPAAAAFFDQPSRKLQVIGVTGTDGKSTTVYLIHQLLEALGQTNGFLSTVNFQTAGEVHKNSLRQSTPEAPEVHGLLREMAQAGKRYAVLEATSHGLSERTSRLGDVRFQAAVCTNITHEHLEFHGTFEQYRSDKANLFRALDREEVDRSDAGGGSGRGQVEKVPSAIGRGRGGRAEAPQRPSAIRRGAATAERFGVVNMDDPSHIYLAAQTRARVYTYSIRASQADLSAGEFHGNLQGTDFTVRMQGREERARLNLPGLFNVENLLAAALTVHRLLDVPLAELCPQFPRLRGVTGRMQAVRAGQPFQVIVDYAHTPQAFEKMLPLARQYTSGRLIAVFGSAGERDVAKRSHQGEIAGRYCSILVLTDEDPRGEDREAILRDIACGCRLGKGQELHLEPDRRQAIQLALGLARPEDTVLLLGKGHEESIIYADGPIPWNETEVAQEILSEMGFRG